MMQHSKPGTAVSTIAPHGGRQKDLLVDDERAQELKEESVGLLSWDLTERQVCDLELLLNGGFSRLEGFLGRADYESVCSKMRLADGAIWPMPIALDVSEAFAEGLVRQSPRDHSDPLPWRERR